MDFEIPYFKKQAEKVQQQIGDQSQRHEEYLRNAESAAKDFKQVQPHTLACHACPNTFLLRVTLATQKLVLRFAF